MPREHPLETIEKCQNTERIGSSGLIAARHEQAIYRFLDVGRKESEREPLRCHMDLSRFCSPATAECRNSVRSLSV